MTSNFEAKKSNLEYRQFSDIILCMSDPRRIKKLGKITMNLKYDNMDKPIQFHSLVDAEILKNVPKEVLIPELKAEISKVSLKHGTELHETLVAASFVCPLQDFEFGNTLVEVNLPYCLHSPNNSELEVSINEKQIRAFVAFHKIWTRRAMTEEGNSDTTDFYADDLVLYFNKSTILGPRLPYVEEDGWDSYITGRNIEKANDRNGVFRYTKLYIQLDLGIPEDISKLNEKSRDELLNEIEEKSLLIVNRIIDNYRELTNEIHVRRLGELKINFIYFTKQNIGFYMSNFNISTAIMNRSGGELKELSTRLSSGAKPTLYKLLLLDAKDSFNNKDYTLAIIESFQALEIFIENYLISELKKEGRTKSEYKKILEKNWRIKDRLNKLLKGLKKVSLNERTELWQPWCSRYDKTRNEAIHLGKEPTHKETAETLDINEKVIEWVSKL